MAASFRLIQPTNYAEGNGLSPVQYRNAGWGGRRSDALTRMAVRHFTSVTGTSVRCITLVATDPSTMPETAPRPRDPITM